MSKVLIIGCGGVASVAIHKCCQVPEVFTEICIASRTKAKCDKLAAELAPKTTTKITTAQVDADHVDEVIALIKSYQPDLVMNIALPYQDLTIMDACLACGDRTTGDYVRELGHDWNAGTVVQAPRLTKEGLLEQTCRRCGAEQKTVLPVLESCAGTICPSHDYHDAPEFGHWSHAGIDYTLELGLFRGTSDTEFSPNVAMTRAMLVTVLYRLDGQKEPTGANPFTDVEPDSWYTEAVIWAVENEIVLGMGDGTFAPEAERVVLIFDKTSNSLQNCSTYHRIESPVRPALSCPSQGCGRNQQARSAPARPALRQTAGPL